MVIGSDAMLRQSEVQGLGSSEQTSLRTVDLDVGASQGWDY
ncbi:hypothetical protein [Nocardia sp. NPDC049707]